MPETEEPNVDDLDVEPDFDPRGDRPVPSSPIRLWLWRAQAWIRWVGVARLVSGIGAAAFVVAVLWWMARSPPPASSEPFPASASVASTAAALPAVEPVTTAAPTTSIAVLVVHVVGAVADPGVYELRSGARVADAIDTAGGATPDGDPDLLNLAAPLTDGDRVAVPRAGEDGADGHVRAGDDPGQGDRSAPVNINTAGAADLETLPGIGPATAGAIVADREVNGPFAEVADLERVRGIGPAKLAALDGLVTV